MIEHSIYKGKIVCHHHLCDWHDVTPKNKEGVVVVRKSSDPPTKKLLSGICLVSSLRLFRGMYNG